MCANAYVSVSACISFAFSLDLLYLFICCFILCGLFCVCFVCFDVIFKDVYIVERFSFFFKYFG